MRVLLVEDDLLLGETISDALTAEGYVVDWLVRGDSVRDSLRNDVFDLVVMDNRMPGRSGLQILTEIRGAECSVPVLMLSACDSLQDKVSGLDAGADDYMTKPFDMDELFARIRSLLRRHGLKTPMLSAGLLTLDVSSRQVFFDQVLVPELTAKEISILEVLLRNQPRFVAKHRLLESSSSWDDEITLNTIEVYISRLRKRFGANIIQTMRGVGYRIAV
ncbi:MAG: response regulator transcription factor [Halieaceae bacterium]|nr:response regulator transcription factor [Halieaceae bacterium]